MESAQWRVFELIFKFKFQNLDLASHFGQSHTINKYKYLL